MFKSDFDFKANSDPGAQRLYKIHGSIDKDIVDDSNSRIVITASDYDYAEKYRENIFDRFRSDCSESTVLIIGYSLADPDIRPIIEEAIRRKDQSQMPGKVYLLLYTQDDDRAVIFEDRGITVAFGSLDDLFHALSAKMPPNQLVFSLGDDPLDIAPGLHPVTRSVGHAVKSEQKNVMRLFNGRPANFAEIGDGLTFHRDISDELESWVSENKCRIISILGAAGVGKTTAVRQALYSLASRGIYCWEHKDEFALSSKRWGEVHAELIKRGEKGVLFVDDAHSHMIDVNHLCDKITKTLQNGLFVILVSTKYQWNPRMKTPAIFSHGEVITLSQLSAGEIANLLNLLDASPLIREMVEDKFMGFSRPERYRRLVDRCGADMFVCLKNIFGFDSIDHILLQEYADLQENYQEIYRTIAAMQAAGVRVHRQLVVRTLGIDANYISTILDNLADIVFEYTISERDGLFGWACRHPVIAETLTRHKFVDQEEAYDLLAKVVEHLNPTYQVEVRTIRDLCDMTAGVGRIRDKNKQNILLRKMISVAPGERVPRHRLVRNLIDLADLEQAQTEMRVFERELGLDAPLQRYKVLYELRRAETVENIMEQDRVNFVQSAAALAEGGLRKFPDDKNLNNTYCEVGYQYLKGAGEWEIFDKALDLNKQAEERILDPDLRRTITHFERRAQHLIGQA